LSGKGFGQAVMTIKHVALALALAGGSALLPAAPAWATIETPEARTAAADAALTAREEMREQFGTAWLKAGEYRWKGGKGPAEVTRVVVSLADQMAYAYRDDELIGVSTISSGTDGRETPTGIFPVLEKKRFHRSIKYDNAPMPFMLRLDDYGIALHAGHLPGYPASHGCIRLPAAFASKLFAATSVGTEVMIGGADAAPAVMAETQDEGSADAGGTELSFVDSAVGN
jgi:hypothetical protein